MGQDPVAAALGQYKVVLENDRVRVLESRNNPGDKTAMHSHPDLVAIAITGGKFKFAGPDGHSFEIELGDGDVVFTDAHSHTTENLGDTASHVILVDLK